MLQFSINYTYDIFCIELTMNEEANVRASSCSSISRTVVTVTYLNIEPSISNMSEYSHQ